MCETSLVSDHVDGSLGIFPYHGVNRDRPPRARVGGLRSLHGIRQVKTGQRV